MGKRAATTLPLGVEQRKEVVVTTESKPRRRANELDGKTWLQFSISVWNDIRKTKEELELRHPAMFPKQLPNRLIQIFTTREQTKVLDPFLGIGSTLVAAKELGKQGIGLDISKEYVDIARKRLDEQLEMFRDRGTHQEVIQDDARNLRKYVADKSIDLVITSPPYWDILSEQRTADYKTIRDYEEQQGNLAALHDYRKFIQEIQGIFTGVNEVLKPECYCIVVVMDVRKKAKYYPLHMDIITLMEEIGFIHDDIIIWDRRQEYNNLRPIGYPSVFRVNKIHEYILIFKKASKSK